MSPLIGYIDPSHYERRHSREGRLPHWLTLDELLTELEQPNPKFAPWTWELANAVIQEHQERGDRISSSLLTGGDPRAEVIKRKEDYIGDLDDEYYILRGTMVHRTLESYTREEAIPEVRFYTTVDGIEFSASPDLLTREALYDYKVSDNPPSYGYAYRHHTEQVQLNSFITRHAEKWEEFDGSSVDLPFDPREYPVEHAVVVYLGPKGPKPLETQRKETIRTPAGVEREVKRPYVWSDDEVLDVFRPRLHVMRAALASYPEWPEPVEVLVDGELQTFRAEEVWGGEPGWACQGPPICQFRDCVARRKPDMYVWPKRCSACKGAGKRGRGVCKRCHGSGAER